MARRFTPAQHGFGFPNDFEDEFIDRKSVV